ncbi:MAG TPA: hypothetical protein VE961_24230 [Pyrinomonadaceae bacterium]|nr:hypothetical protein [Pyrinomonadaceae bacterium]
MLTLIRAALLTTLFASACSAQAWRGIAPLHSTKADVVRLFGVCQNSQGGCEFTRSGEDVYIVFSSIANPLHDCEKELPTDTVLLVEVKPKAHRRLTDLVLDRTRFRTFEPSYPPNIGYKGYINEAAGLIIKTYKGSVLQFDYIAAAKDAHRCASYYEDPESFVSVFIESFTPVVSVSCPTEPVVPGNKFVCTATTYGKPKYKWQLSAGRILAGQGTPNVTIGTTGWEGQKITISIEADDRHGTITTATCAVLLAKAPDH